MMWHAVEIYSRNLRNFDCNSAFPDLSQQHRMISLTVIPFCDKKGANRMIDSFTCNFSTHRAARILRQESRLPGPRFPHDSTNLLYSSPARVFQTNCAPLNTI